MIEHFLRVLRDQVDLVPSPHDEDGVVDFRHAPLGAEALPQDVPFAVRGDLLEPDDVCAGVGDLVIESMTRLVLLDFKVFQLAIFTFSGAPGFGLGVGTPESASAATSPAGESTSVSNAARTAQCTPLRVAASA